MSALDLGHRRVRAPSRLAPSTIAVALIVVVFAAATPFLSEYALQIGFRIILYIVLAEAWNLLAGYTGLVSLGSSSFVGIGAYTLVLLFNKAALPLAPALLLAGVFAAALAVLVAPAVFRMRGLYFTVGTLALGEALRLFVINVPTFGGASGFFLDQDPLPIAALYLYALVLLVVASLIMTAATQTRISVILRSIRDDEDAAMQVGVRAFRVKLLVFATASFMMGLAGGLQGYKLGAIEPYGMFGLSWSVDILSIVVIGGAGQRLGPIVGAIFVVGLGEALADYPEIHIALTGLILIIVIRFAPHGLCGLVTSVFESRRQRRDRAIAERGEGRPA